MNCLHCNKPIESKRNTKKYCSNTCKQYSYLKRNLGEVFPTEIKTIEEIRNQDYETDKKQLSKSIPPIGNSGYKKIRPKVLSLLENPPFNVERYSEYLSTRIGGKIRPENIRAFSYVCRRVRCIIENLFLLSYKRKVYFNTIHHLRKALEETLTSDYVKQIPSDFPFSEILFDLYMQLKELEKILKENKEGIKFTLEKNKIVLYANVLRIVREFVTGKQPFTKLFPHFFKS